MIDELASEGFRFDKLLNVLEESRLHHLSSELRNKFNKAPKEILDFLTKGLHKNPEKRLTLSEIGAVIANYEATYSKHPILQTVKPKPNTNKELLKK